MMLNHSIIVSMRTLFAFLILAVAQTGYSATPIYNVELLFFTQVSGSSEQFPDYPGTPKMDTNLPPLGSQHGYSIINGGRLAGVRNRLERTAGYHPLHLLAWRQPLPNNTVPKPAKIDIQVPTGERIIGTVALGRSKYAILRVDVLLQEHGVTYRLKDEIRMQRNEIHYIDHPKMGILATITKIN
jgi:hypothetical protein